MLRAFGAFTSIVLVAAFAACSSSPSGATAQDAGPAADAGVDSAPGPDCTDPATAPTAPCGTLSWATSHVASRPRNHHVTFIVPTKSGPLLYAIGGVSNGVVIPNADRASIADDGSLGAWTDSAPLPVASGGLTGGTVGNVIVVAGGQTSGGVTDLSYSTVVQDDGSLAPWKKGPSVLQKRMHPGGFAIGDSIYVLGGFADPNVWDDAVRATVMPDGTVSPWISAGKLLGPRSHFSVTRVGDYVYVAGGLAASALANPPVLDEVARAKIQSDGSLGDWTTMPKLPEPLATHSSFFWGGWLYVGGGITDAAHEKKLWRAPIGADHALGAWELAAPLPIARGHVHQLPIWNDHVYSVSGAVDFNLASTSHVEVGTFQ